MGYEFSGNLYITLPAMMDAIAERFLTAGGLNTAGDVADILATHSDASLASEAVREWRLDDPGAGLHGESHMARYRYDAGDLEAAFRFLRRA